MCFLQIHWIANTEYLVVVSLHFDKHSCFDIRFLFWFSCCFFFSVLLGLLMNIGRVESLHHFVFSPIERRITFSFVLFLFSFLLQRFFGCAERKCILWRRWRICEIPTATEVMINRINNSYSASFPNLAPEDEVQFNQPLEWIVSLRTNPNNTEQYLQYSGMYLLDAKTASFAYIYANICNRISTRLNK